MCGIAGIVVRQAQPNSPALPDLAARMVGTLQHRGPDGTGVWADTTGQAAFGHQRLAVIDVSPAGHQPMTSACGRYTIVFNGEIYNHRDLRQELTTAGHSFRGHSDTEVLLTAIADWGFDKVVSRINGMFAIAVWDTVDRRLTLIRDRMGIKPLYYVRTDSHFLFGSELKALRAHPEFVGEIDRDALASYLAHNYIPAPHTIYRNVKKLKPGTMLTLRPGDEWCEATTTYWSVRQAVEHGQAHPFAGTEAEALEQLDGLIADAVRLRLEADVPLGAFLSGGIDSSIVAAAMTRQCAGRVKTFSIGFHEQQYNEADHALAVARHLKTDHTEYYVTDAEARNVIPRLPQLYDEPFSDSSQIPTFLVSQLARQHVTVALSGDGGDELFAGYNRYEYFNNLWRRMGWLPYPLRRGLSAVSLACARPFRKTVLGRKVERRARYISIRDGLQMYELLNTHWRESDGVAIGGRRAETELSLRANQLPVADYRQQMMYLDAVTYLPDDILVKVDRASMGVSLEARVPLLDHRMVEFAWQLPMSMKVHNGQTKWLLRQHLSQYVPTKLFERPKMGFGVPIDSWLRGPLREWAEELLDERQLREQGFLNPTPIRACWEEHLSGRADWHYPIWDVLMFQAWYAETMT